MTEDDAAALLSVVRCTRGQTRSRLAELPRVRYDVLSLLMVCGLVGIGSRRSSRRTP